MTKLLSFWKQNPVSEDDPQTSVTSPAYRWDLSLVAVSCPITQFNTNQAQRKWSQALFRYSLAIFQWNSKLYTLRGSQTTEICFHLKPPSTTMFEFSCLHCFCCRSMLCSQCDRTQKAKTGSITNKSTWVLFQETDLVKALSTSSDWLHRHSKEAANKAQLEEEMFALKTWVHVRNTILSLTRA